MCCSANFLLLKVMWLLQNEKIALALAPGITIILVLFGGFYANSSTIPKALRWCASSI